MIALVGFCAVASAQTVGLVGYWNFNESSGTIAHNSVPGGPDGVLSGGASFVPAGGGMYGGNAIKLDHATNGLVNFGDNYSFAAGSFSVVVWVKLSAGDTTPMYPLTKNDPGAANGYVLGIGAIPDGRPSSQPGYPQFITSGFSSGQADHVDDGKWHMLMGSYDATSHVTKVGVDGGGTTGAGPAPAMAASSALLLIGGASDPTGATNKFSGLVDEVRIYDHALTPGEQIAIYNLTLPEPSITQWLLPVVAVLFRGRRASSQSR